jgi:two-component system, cell cycle response regulator DivK
MKQKIAIIEDNIDNRVLVRAFLGDIYDLQEYESGREGLAGMERLPPDLVLLDISLPEMDGVEVLSHIRVNEHLWNLPVIALTAHAMSGDRERLLEVGFDDYIAKPIVDEREFLEVVKRGFNLRVRTGEQKHG